MSLPPRDTFGRQWLVFWAVVGLGWLGWRSVSHLGAAEPAPEIVREGPADWFMVLRMPPITSQYESGVDVMKTRYERWLIALERAGYRPIRLSEVFAARKAGRGLPERSVVLVFEPGLRRTQEIVEPIFRRRGWSGVWLTDARAMRRGNRELITHRTARAMIDSGWWDVGFSKRWGDGYVLRSREGKQGFGGRKARPWSDVEGTFALNRGTATDGLNVLTVNTDWTAEDLVNRLDAELPLEHRSCLVKAAVQRDEWGVSRRAPRAGGDCPAFDLEPELFKRDTRVHWLGSAGARDVKLVLSAAKVVGELRLHLFRDEARDRRVSVVLGEHSLSVDEREGDKVRRILTFPHGSRRKPFHAEITVRGGRVAVRLNGGGTSATERLKLWDGGLLVLQLAENMRGVARAAGVRLSFEPL